MTCSLCEFKMDPIAPTCKNGPCNFCVEATKVGEEIKQTMAALERLHAKRYDLLSEHNRVHDPMHRLPLELKTNIFELALPTRDEWGERLCDESRPYLTSICKGWRDIAWSIPSLWSTIPIMLESPSTSDSSWVDFVHNWILRSRTSPLTLYIEVYSDDDSNDLYELVDDNVREQLDDVLDVLIQCPNEWQSLSLQIPSSLSARFYYNNDLQPHLLAVRKLRINCSHSIDQPVLPLNVTTNLEKIEIHNLSFQSVRISWNHLTSAEVHWWDLGCVAQLFQHASQMTYCSIWDPQCRTANFAMPLIIHGRLETLSLRWDGYPRRHVSVMLLGSLTLPCLRAVQMDLVVAGHIPALVDRSSCPLTRVTLFGGHRIELLRPLPGVTDLVLETVYDKAELKQLLFTGCFPDLRHLTLPLPAFVALWQAGFIFPSQQPEPDTCNKATLRKVFVRGADNSYPTWYPEFARQLEAFRSCISWREDGFEFLLPGVGFSTLLTAQDNVVDR